jgi:tetratricopeptide (TPR) repeat protein
MLARDGDVALAAWASGESRAIAQHIGDRKREADALANLGYLALQRGDSTEANDLFVACLDINRALGNAQGLADAVSFLALTAYYRDDINTARRLNEESLAIWESLDDHQGVVWARTRLASVLVRQREHRRALAELVASLATARELDFRWGLSWSFDGLARLAADRGMVRVAASLADAAASVREDAGLRLSPAEEAEVRELRRSLSSKLGANAPEMTAADSWQTPDALVRAIHDCVAGDPA